LTPKVVALTF